MERVKEHSFYPKPQETVNPFAQRPAAHASRVMAMTSSLFLFRETSNAQRPTSNAESHGRERPPGAPSKIPEFCSVAEKQNGIEALKFVSARRSNQYARRVRYPISCVRPALAGESDAASVSNAALQ
jgi:hypothetical protein